MAVRGIRGAVVAEADREEAILSAAVELLEAMVEANPGVEPEDVASIFFTVSGDLNAAYPAYAARRMGWTGVPLLCAREIDVPGGLPRTIRVLLHWNTDRSQKEIRHVYLGAAAALRPDWVVET